MLPTQPTYFPKTNLTDATDLLDRLTFLKPILLTRPTYFPKTNLTTNLTATTDLLFLH